MVTSSIAAVRAAVLVGSLLLGAGGCALPLASESEIDAQGEAAFSKLRAELPISTDTALRAYVGCVVDAIVRELPAADADGRWEVEIFDKGEINAFALPGGYIGVFTGMLKVARNQDQLAAVIGHEIAHVTQRHSLKRYNREATTQIGITGVAIATGIDPQVTDLLGAAAQLGLALPFSRGEESEADAVGLDYMAAAGFDPGQSVLLWQNMKAASGRGPPEFLSTHPSPDNRIEELRARITAANRLYEAARAAGLRPDCGPPP
jgi:predicted Zn-dependent protease